MKIVIGGFPFLKFDAQYEAAIAEAHANSEITFECDICVEHELVVRYSFFKNSVLSLSTFRVLCYQTY